MQNSVKQIKMRIFLVFVMIAMFFIQVNLIFTVSKLLNFQFFLSIFYIVMEIVTIISVAGIILKYLLMLISSF